MMMNQIASAIDIMAIVAGVLSVALIYESSKTFTKGFMKKCSAYIAVFALFLTLGVATHFIMHIFGQSEIAEFVGYAFFISGFFVLSITAYKGVEFGKTFGFKGSAFVKKVTAEKLVEAGLIGGGASRKNRNNQIQFPAPFSIFCHGLPFISPKGVFLC